MDGLDARDIERHPPQHHYDEFREAAELFVQRCFGENELTPDPKSRAVLRDALSSFEKTVFSELMRQKSTGNLPGPARIPWRVARASTTFRSEANQPAKPSKHPAAARTAAKRGRTAD